MSNTFMGKDGFYWWQGVVEDRNDPLMTGRCRVRILGIHTDDKSASGIATSDLPWAMILLPVNQEERIVPPKEGSWVMGFFRDGDHCQDPVIFGVLPGIPEEESPNLSKSPEEQKGFFDPAGHGGANDALMHRPINLEKGFTHSGKLLNNEVKRNSEEEMQAMLNNTYPMKSRLGEPDTHRLARNEDLDKTILKWKCENRLINIVSNNSRGEDSGQVQRTFWSEPDPILIYNAKYPYNKVMESESGHIIEIDDTLGHERIHTFHRSGTFDEMQPNGDRVMKTFGNSYRITYLDDHYVCFGTKHETFGGDKVDQYQRAKGEIIGGNKTSQLHGDDTRTVGFSSSSYIGKGHYTTVESGDGNHLTEAGNYRITVNNAESGELHLKSDYDLNLTSMNKVEILALKEINTQALDAQRHTTNKDFQLLAGQSMQIDAGAIVQIQSHNYCKFKAKTQIDIAAPKTNIDATLECNISGESTKIGGTSSVKIDGPMVYINCNSAIAPKDPAIANIPSTPVVPATGAQHAAKGNANITTPSKLGTK